MKMNVPICIILLCYLAYSHAVGSKANKARSNQVSVQGDAQARLVPDEALINLSITKSNVDSGTASNEVKEVVMKVLQLCESLKIDKEDISTTASSLQPKYKYDRKREENVFMGYTATRQISIEVKDLDILGTVIQQSTSAGVTNIQEPQLYSSQKKEKYREVLKQAFTDAKENAQALMTAAGTELGNAISITTSGRPHPIQPRFKGRMAAFAMEEDGMPDTSYNAGELTLSVTVSVIFEINE